MSASSSPRSTRSTRSTSSSESESESDSDSEKNSPQSSQTIEQLESKLEAKASLRRSNPRSIQQIQQKLSFVPRVNVHRDLARWFCNAFKYAVNQDMEKLNPWILALRKSIWTTSEEKNSSNFPAARIHELELNLDSRSQRMLHYMVELMKVRTASFARTTREVQEYVQRTLEHAKAMVKTIRQKEHAMKNGIKHKSEKLRRKHASLVQSGNVGDVGDTSAHESEDGAFAAAFDPMNPTDSTNSVHLDVLKKKALELYANMDKLRKERVQAIVQHNQVKVFGIDSQIHRIKTTTRAITGARRYLRSIRPDTALVPSFDGAMESIDEALGRLAECTTKTDCTDAELFHAHASAMIDEHDTGMQLFIGLKAEQEIARLRRDLVAVVCQNVVRIFGRGHTEVMLLNKELASLHGELMAHQSRKETGRISEIKAYLIHAAKLNRGKVAKTQLKLLEIVDRRRQ